MKRALAILTVFCVFLLSGCEQSGYSKTNISKTLGIDISSAEYMTTIDTHGGFFGDGTAHVIVPLEGSNCLEQIQSNNDWHELPLSENLTAIVYGIKTENASIGPYITFDDSGSSGIPEIENGYYFFLDRHSQSTDPSDDSSVLARASFNLTIAIYDADTDTLHYLELDT